MSKKVFDRRRNPQENLDAYRHRIASSSRIVAEVYSRRPEVRAQLTLEVGYFLIYMLGRALGWSLRRRGAPRDFAMSCAGRLETETLTDFLRRVAASNEQTPPVTHLEVMDARRTIYDKLPLVAKQPGADDMVQVLGQQILRLIPPDEMQNQLPQTIRNVLVSLLEGFPLQPMADQLAKEIEPSMPRE